jgi:cysteinyl-tRNA synthetase
MRGTPLRLHDSLTRTTSEFVTIDPSAARVYSCGPTVYHDAHIGNLRAYVFTDTLVRTLRWKDQPTVHVVNITDVGHLVADADNGDDKMERAATREGRDAWAVAAMYTERFLHDVDRLGIVRPNHLPRATDYVQAMIEYAGRIEGSCYRLPSGLYFDTSTVPGYGDISGKASETLEGRIEAIDGKRQPADFAVWRTTPAGERRQMEWDSPWGRGAPGWHLECSVMSNDLLGERFDIHTGGIDHREVHHPNEIAQNMAHSCSSHPGAERWMHNNFLVDRRGKMAKSAGGFLTLQKLVDRGFHPLSYRMMCLQAHYRSELEFGFQHLLAAQTRLKRIVQTVERLRLKDDGRWSGNVSVHLKALDEAVSDDLNTPRALVALETMLASPSLSAHTAIQTLKDFDAVLGLDLSTLDRTALRTRPVDAAMTGDEVEDLLARRIEARATKDFAASDAARAVLLDSGIEVMDGDPLRWDWRPDASEPEEEA